MALMKFRRWCYLTFCWDASKPSGRLIPYVGKYTDLNENSPIILALRKSAWLHLPRGLFYVIRLSPPTDFGRCKAVAWYYEPGLLSKHSEFVFRFGGYFVTLTPSIGKQWD